MNNLSGMLVEYLAIGSTSVVWIALLLIGIKVPIESLSGPILAGMAPSIYVLGMMSDFSGYLIVYKHKKAIRKSIKATSPEHDHLSQKIYIDVMSKYPEVAKDISIRSSRDRVARGVLPNIPLIGFASILYINKEVGINISIVIPTISLVTLLIFVLTYSMWIRFQKNSYRHEVYALELLRHEALEQTKGP